MDWDLFRAFLAVADTGSHSAAARRLGLSHATIGRRVREIEEAIGTRLLVRQADGYALTAAGTRLRTEVEAMAAAAARAAQAAAEEAGSPRGAVRISTAATMAGYWLMPHMGELHARYPDLEVEFVTDAWPASVRRREADIVIRLYGPGEENLVGRKIARAGVAFYASKDYAAEHGLPASRGEWADHTLIGFAGEAASAELARWSRHVTRDTPTYLRCSSMPDILRAVRIGVGIGVMTCMIGDSHDDLVRIAPDKLYSATDVWLLAHPDLVDTPPVRAVLDFINECARRDAGLLLGRRD